MESLPAVDNSDYVHPLENTIELLTNEITRLRDENDALKKRLIIYENSHTLLSLLLFKPKAVTPKGKSGATKVLGEPGEIVHVSVEKCPNCSHILGAPIRTEKRKIFDIPQPQKVKVIEYDLDIYECGNFGTEVRSKHIDCPQKGDMGIYLLNYITMLKYNLRDPIRRIQEFLIANNDLDLSVKGINDSLIRVHIDESGFHVNGKKY